MWRLLSVTGLPKCGKRFYRHTVLNSRAFGQFGDVRRLILQLCDCGETGTDAHTDLGSRIVLGGELIGIFRAVDTIDPLVKKFDVSVRVGVARVGSAF